MTDPAFRSRTTRIALVALLPLAATVVAHCTTYTAPSLPTVDGLVAGTWGGENAGLIVSDSSAHVHVGCTYGDFPAPVAVDADGRFDAAGSYLLRAYPVAVGPTLPARFAGVLRGDRVTLTVTVDDTVARKSVVLGPVTATYGKEPRLGPCPICRIVNGRRVPSR